MFIEGGDICDDNAPFTMCYESAASSVQVHAHTFTCRKGPLGQCYCRMAYPQAIHEGRTGPTELVPYSMPGSTVDLSYKDIQVRPLDETTELVIDIDITNNWPLYPPDERIIARELTRGYVGEDSSYEFYQKNRFIVPFSKSLTAVTGSNSAIYHLGSEKQAKGASYYIMNYMTKDATEMKNILSLIYEAMIQATKYKSQAVDWNSDERKATKFLTSINNNLSAKSEMSAIMAAAGLLGMKSFISSHPVTYIYIHPAIDFVRSQLKTLQCTLNLMDVFDDENNQYINGKFYCYISS